MHLTLDAILKRPLHKFSGMGRGGTGGKSPPPAKPEKIVVEKWCYLPELHTFGEDAEITEKFSENVWKKSIFNRDFDQKSRIFLNFFQNLGLFWAKCAKFSCRFLRFPVWWKLFVKYWLSCIFKQIRVNFLQKFQ